MTRSIPLLALLLPACVVAKIGSGEPATLEASFDAVEAIHLATFVDTTVTVTPGAALTTLSLTCDDSLLDDLEASVVDGVLVLDDDAPYALIPQTDCHAEVDLPALHEVRSSGSGRLTVDSPVDGLEQVEASGSGGVFLDTVSACELALESSGSGPLEIDGLAACVVSLTASGSGGVSLVGTADAADVRVHGSGGFGEADFVVDDLVLTLTGSGGAELTALDSAEVTVTGSGGATIHGDPQVRDVEITGSGSVDFE